MKPEISPAEHDALAKISQPADQRQVSGNHYKDMPVQPWAVMEAALSPADQRQVSGSHYKDMQPNDPVNKPAHYTNGGIETIEYIRAKLTPDQLRGYYLGNLLKYLSRAQHKDGPQDYRKATVYLRWLNELEDQEAQKK
jgi:hypothetical protein